MDKRREYMSNLKTFIEGIDKEVTMILQSLQWDRKHLIEGPNLVSCRYDLHHKIPPDKKELHEQDCFLKAQGYSADDKMLPEPFDTAANTLVKLSKEDINQIIDKASMSVPVFKKGKTCAGPQPPPLTAERLRATYTADERRALHDAVVAAVPSCHDLADLALPSIGEEAESGGVKSRLEILAELRDMRRRRAKYRVAANTTNYSHVLRQLITTQMEFYSETQNTSATSDNINKHSEKNFFLSNKNKLHIDDATDRKRKREQSTERYGRNSYSKDRTRFETTEELDRYPRSKRIYANEHDERSYRRRDHKSYDRECNSSDVQVKQEKDDSSFKHRSNIYKRDDEREHSRSRDRRRHNEREHSKRRNERKDTISRRDERDRSRYDGSESGRYDRRDDPSSSRSEKTHRKEPSEMYRERDTLKRDREVHTRYYDIKVKEENLN